MVSTFTYSMLATGWRVLNRRDCIAMAIAASISFAVFYVFFTGTGTMMTTSNPIPAERAVPSIDVTPKSHGNAAWITVYLTRYNILAMNLNAMIPTVLMSALVGINSALMLYDFRITKTMRCNSRVGGPAFLGSIVPASFSAFACCGGGILLTLFGAGLVTTLVPYRDFFSVISIVGLTAAVCISVYIMNSISRASRKDLTTGAV